MKALLIGAPGSVELVELPRPQPAAGEVAVRVARAGVCATDRRMVARGADPPRVPGHEGAGFLGDGTPVGIHPDVGCGRCRYCRGGFENRCLDRLSIGIDRDGALAEWVTIPSDHVVPLDGLAVELAPLLEPLACCLHALHRMEVEPGETVVVVGAGSMGMLATWALQAAGARVGVCQRSGPRRELAGELGADAVMGPRDDPAAVLDEAPTAVLVAAPGPDALRWALERVAVGGRV
ncbi:MAG: zinc-dependent alcohol dehydrogenase, partial [Acidimicrobiia bacterium]